MYDFMMAFFIYKIICELQIQFKLAPCFSAKTTELKVQHRIGARVKDKGAICLEYQKWQHCI
jgi:hypothetical protein